MTLELLSLGPSVQPAAPSRPFPVAGVSLLSAGLISGGLGVFFALRASSASSEVTAFARPGAVTWDATWVKTERAGQQEQLAAQLLFGGGGALVISGVIATFVSAFSEPGKPTAQLLIMPTAQGVTASCAVSF